MNGCKQCTKCKRWKQVRFFNKRRYSKNGLKYQCRACTNEYVRRNKPRFTKTKIKRQIEDAKTNRKRYNKRIKNSTDYFNSINRQPVYKKCCIQGVRTLYSHSGKFPERTTVPLPANRFWLMRSHG